MKMNKLYNNLKTPKNKMDKVMMKFFKRHITFFARKTKESYSNKMTLEKFYLVVCNGKNSKTI